MEIPAALHLTNIGLQGLKRLTTNQADVGKAEGEINSSDRVKFPVNASIPEADAASASRAAEAAFEKAAAKKEHQLEQAGTQFEELFVSMLMKQMRDTLEEGLFGGEGSDTLGAIFDLYLGKHLATSSPLGIGQAVKSYLKAGSING